MRILLIEDDSATAQSICLMLRSEGLIVHDRQKGSEGLHLAREGAYDMILLDLNLPDMSGYDLIKILRKERVGTPIIIISGLAGIQDQVKGLGIGADAYITKPFHKDLLVANMYAVIRRVRGHTRSVIEVGGLELNINEKSFKVDGSGLNLTSKEYALLELLTLRAGAVVTKTAILTHLYPEGRYPEEKIIDVFVSKVRKKISRLSGGVEYIGTIWGKGYTLRDPAAANPAQHAV